MAAANSLRQAFEELESNRLAPFVKLLEEVVWRGVEEARKSACDFVCVGIPRDPLSQVQPQQPVHATIPQSSLGDNMSAAAKKLAADNGLRVTEEGDWTHYYLVFTKKA